VLRRVAIHRSDSFWICLAIGLSAAQLAATIADRNVWPISAYNVFNFRPGIRFVDFEVALTDTEGARFLVHPGRTMPLDFFRANAILRDRFVIRTEPGVQFQLASLILRTLNERTWHAWDERYEAASTLTEHDFRVFELVVVEHDTASMSVLGRVPIYSYIAAR
jgi:hypothetical protein